MHGSSLGSSVGSLPGSSPDLSHFVDVVRQSRVWFLSWTLCGLALRLLFLRWWPTETPDGQLYAELAHSLLTTGHYLRQLDGVLIPSTARLPGYPTFLALIFRIVGDGNLLAVRLVQVGIDMATVLAVAWLAFLVLAGQAQERRRRAVRYAFALTAACPFLAMYTAAILTETAAVFCTVLALGCGLMGERTGRWRWWLGCGAALAVAIQLRPDSGLLLILFGARLLWNAGTAARQARRSAASRPVASQPIASQSIAWLRLRNLVVLGGVALAPVALWTVRNAVALHIFRPLVTTEATEVGEPEYRGFEAWSRTWLASFRGVEDILNSVPGESLDPSRLPARAFDNAQQRQQTLALIGEYNRTDQVTPLLDARFAALARERGYVHPLRTLLALPLARAASLWLSPRLEFLPIDDHWWPPRVYWRNDPRDFSFTVLWIGLNLSFLGLGIWGLVEAAPAEWPFWLLFLLARTAMLAFLGTCEPRYTLETYPILLVWGASALARLRRERRPVPGAAVA